MCQAQDSGRNKMASQKLRFGIICRGTTFPAWQAECLRQLVGAGAAEPSLIIIPAVQPSRANARGRGGVAWTAGLLFRACERLWIRRRSIALRPVAMETDLRDVPRLCGKTAARGDVGGLAATDIAAINDLGLDFILAFVDGEIPSEIMRAAKYGVWRYRHGSAAAGSMTQSLFWDVFENRHVSNAALVCISDHRSGDVILFQGHFRTRQGYVGTLDLCCLGSAEWCLSVCSRIRLGHVGNDSVASIVDSRPTHKTPTNLQFLAFAWSRCRAATREIWRRGFCLERWNIAVVPAHVGDLMKSGSAVGARWLPAAPTYRYRADPFALPSADHGHVLVEEFRYSRRRGHISLVTIPETKGGRRSEPVIDVGAHMSYPFLIEHEGEIFCIPETSEIRRVLLIRATRFPYQWERAITLVQDFPAVDSTVFQHEGIWWLFCARAGMFSDTKLFAWYADALRGPWMPHPLNPVKCDVRSSRPAGRPFTLDGALFRPAQDCSRTYGGAVAINRIVRLSPSVFEEETVGRIGPDPKGPYPDGLHTICPIGERTLIDGKRTEFDVAAAAVKLSGRVAEGWRRRFAERRRGEDAGHG